MPQYQTTYTPINGLEAKEILKKRLEEFIEKMAHLKAGNTFHKIKLIFKVKVEAFPADVPTPFGELDFEFPDLTPIPDFLLKEFSNQLTTIEYLQALQQKHIDAMNVLEYQLQHLDILSEDEDVLDGTTPDQLRIRFGLDIPVFERLPSGKPQMKYIKADQLHVK